MDDCDLQFCNLGSFAGVYPVSDEGSDWLSENLAEDAMEMNGMILIDFHCLEDIVVGAREAGLICHG